MGFLFKPPMKYSVILAFTIFLSWNGFGQGKGDYSFQPNIPTIPPPPDAAALGKFGEIPVSLYTGIPSISIPIYTVSVSGFQLPISLDYHAGGVRVDEISSTVGLGWALNAGGAVAVKINSGADRFADGTWVRKLPNNVNTFNPNEKITGTYNYSDDYNFSILATEPHPTVDAMPDEFMYNFAGKGGKIVFDENQVPYTVPFDPIKISGFFKIIDENGVTFDFNNYETTASRVQCTPTQPRPSPNPHISSYYLSKITTPKGETISFVYESLTYTYDQSWTESASVIVANIGCATDPLKSYCKNIMTVHGVRIKSITSSDGTTVTFNYDTADREDLPGTNRLMSVAISDTKGNDKIFTLTHSYFGTTGKRLKLDAVTEEGKSPYTFSYIQSDRLPARLSYSQDHWGFYNGENNLGLIPTQNIVGDNTILKYSGANRAPNGVYAAYGTLDKIVYPTGGSTVFEYEANDYFSEVDEVEIIQQHTGVTAGITSEDDRVNGIQTLQTVIDNTTYPYFANGVCTTPPVDGICPQLSWNLPDPTVCRYTVSVYDPSGQNICCENKASGTKTLASITPGTWKFAVNIARCDVGSFADITLSWGDKRVINPYSNKTGSGLRIKSIRNYTDDSQLVGEKSFDYHLKDDPSKSSGKSTDAPKYSYKYMIYNPTSNSNATTYSFALNFKDISRYCQYFALTSYSAEPLGSIKGNSVGYTDVTVYEKGGMGNGKTYNKFKFIEDINPPQPPSYSPVLNFYDWTPRKEYTSYDFLRGLPEQTIEYKTLPDNTYTPVHETNYDYTIRHDPANFWGFQTTGEAANEKNILGLNISRIADYGSNTGEVFGSIFGYYWIKYPSVWYSLNKKTEISYQDNASDNLITEANYFYDNPVHAKVSRETVKNSKDDILTTQTLYPADYTNTSGFIYDMKQGNIVKPIEIVKYKTDVAGSTSILSGVVNTYKPGNQKGLIESARVMNNTAPIAKTAFKFSNQSATNSFPYEGSSADFSLTTIDASYPVSADYTVDYDEHNNIVTVRKFSDAPVAYVWGYNYSMVVAEVKNATYQDVLSVIGQTAIDQLNNNPGSDNNVRQVLSVLRGSPALKKSIITTYTYDPLFGVSSITDNNNQSAYFKYDPSGRLISIRDNNGNIVKNIEYHYRNASGTDMNFVKSTGVQVAGVTQEVDVSALTIGQKLQTIQYMDGLGRLAQQVMTGNSANKMDVVQPVVYDPFGREAVKYLPYVAAESNGNYKTNALGSTADNYTTSPQYNFYQQNSTVANDVQPYQKTVYESSPLNRVVKQGSAGSNWQPVDDSNNTADNTIKHHYEFNGQNEVIFFTFNSTTGLASPWSGSQLQYYPSGKLAVNRSTDEHQHDVIEYIDKEGHTICKKVQYDTDSSLNKLYTETYYIYDDLGNLITVLSPEAVVAIKTYGN